MTSKIAAPWWERRWLLLALVAQAALPLLWPSVPPLTDLPGHMGRYHIQLTLDESPLLQRFFTFEWALTGNLGVDLLVVPLAALMPMETAVKLIIILIPMTMVAGMLLLAREVHGRVPATALFAVPLAYNFPFQYGFVNFSLSMALCLLGLALWIRLGRLRRRRLRAAVFVPYGVLVWVAHAYGWGVLGLLAFAAELVTRRAEEETLFSAARKAALAMLPLVPPMLLMVAWRSAAGSGWIDGWLEWRTKLSLLRMVLRDRWMTFDLVSALICFTVVAAGMVRWTKQIDLRLGLGAALLGLLYAALPWVLFGSYMTDMRIAPYALIVALLAIRPDWPKPGIARHIAVAGVAFVLVRAAALTASYTIYDRDHKQQLEALALIPRGARVLVQAQSACVMVWRESWSMRRIEHIGSLAIRRKDAFTNTQWAVEGAQLLGVHYDAAEPFTKDPSHVVWPLPCRGPDDPILERTIETFPRSAFDYLWLIGVPPKDQPARPDLQLVWQGPRDGALYRVAHRADPPLPPKGALPE